MIDNALLKRKILDSIYNNKDNNFIIEKVIKVFDIVGGSQPPKSQFSGEEKDGYVRLYQTRDYGERPVPVYVKKNSVSKFTKKGDILLARYGGSLGKVFIAEEGAYNVALAKVIIKDSKRFYDKFVYYYFLSSKYQNFTKTLTKMAQAGFNKNDLSDLTIIVPSLEQQKKIVNKIEALFELIDKKEKNDQEKEKLKTLLKEKILDSAIRGKLIENDLSLSAVDVEEIKDNVPFEIPNNWKWTTFYKIIDVRDGTHDSPKYVEYSDYPLITSKNLTKNGLDFENVNYLAKKDYESINVRSFVDDGDILFAMIGSIGNPVLVNKTRNFAIKNVALFKCSKKIYNKYLYYYLQSQGDMSDKTKGGVQKFVSLKILRNYLIPIPPLEQQKKIVEKIEKCFELIEQL